MVHYQKRRGISEVVAVLLMLAIVVTLGVLIYSFASGGMNSLSENYATAMSVKVKAASEKFTVEQVAFAFTGTLSLDGSSTNEVGGASSSIAATLSTTSIDDVVVAYVSAADTGATAPPSVSGISGGGLTWNHRVSTSAETYTEYYVPITLTNSQTSATPSSFQQMVTWDPATYSTYEASDLGNVRFCADSACVSPLYAWLESCTASCGTSATSATAWVNLGSHTIAANGGILTIYMVFEPTATEFDGNYWGEAPSLSPTYAQYDNGANVFAAYFNGNTPTSGFSVYTGLAVVQATGVTGPGATTINAIEISGTTGAHTPSFAFNQALTNTGLITESNFASEDPNDATGANGFMSNPTATFGTMNGISVGEGDGSDYFFMGTDTAGTVDIPIDGSPGGGAPAAGTWLYGSVTYPGTSATSWSAYDSPTLYSPTAGCAACTATDAAAPPITGAANLYLGAIGGSSAVQIYYNFMRARAYPPAGVMPAVALGATSSTTTTFDLEEWYATASSTLTSALITATLSSPDSAATWIAVFGISGANTASPFDPNVSLPATSAATSPSTTMSTSDSSDVLLYACAAGGGSVAPGFTSVYSSAYPPDQNEYVGYEGVSSTQTGLVTSCGTSSYGAEITDAMIASTGGDVYVRNAGNIPTTLVTVYVTDVTSGTFVTQAAISVTVNVGSFAEIPHNSAAFTPSHGHTYSFTVTSSLGNSVIYTMEAT
ncbi:MAG: hypothetical protein OK442_03160 [Thaumarchaeota archaeon]|nr:hypothetical protein [Nitrososphaerota archaeon]